MYGVDRSDPFAMIRATKHALTICQLQQAADVSTRAAAAPFQCLRAPSWIMASASHVNMGECPRLGRKDAAVCGSIASRPRVNADALHSSRGMPTDTRRCYQWPSHDRGHMPAGDNVGCPGCSPASRAPRAARPLRASARDTGSAPGDGGIHRRPIRIDTTMSPPKAGIARCHRKRWRRVARAALRLAHSGSILGSKRCQAISARQASLHGLPCGFSAVRVKGS